MRGCLLLWVLLQGLASVSAQTETTVSRQPAALLGEGAPYRIVFDHVDDRITLESPGGDVLERWDRYAPSVPLTEIPPGRPVAVEIRHANPLLYTYDVRAEVVRTEPLRTCGTLGRRTTSQGFALGSMSVGTALLGGLDPASIAGGLIDLGALLPDAQNVAEPGTRSLTQEATALTEAMLEHRLASVREPVTAYNAYTATLARLAQTIEDSLAWFASMGETVPLEQQLDRFQQRLEQIQPGLSAPARVPQLIQERAREAGNAVGMVRGLAQAVESGAFAGDPTSPAARETVTLARRAEEGAAALQETYPDLQRHLLEIRRLKSRTKAVFALAPGREAVRRLVIEVRPNDDYEHVLRLHEGEVEIYTRPRQSVRCELGVGVAWGASVPSYGVDAAGNLVDEEPNEYRIAPHLLLHVASNRFPILAASLGAGIGDDRTPDFYLGGGLRLAAPMIFNVGVVWQRARRLPDGLAVGRPVPDPAALGDLDKRYRPALFFGISVAR